MDDSIKLRRSSTSTPVLSAWSMRLSKACVSAALRSRGGTVAALSTSPWPWTGQWRVLISAQAHSCRFAASRTRQRRLPRLEPFALAHGLLVDDVVVLHAINIEARFEHHANNRDLDEHLIVRGT